MVGDEAVFAFERVGGGCWQARMSFLLALSRRFGARQRRKDSRNKKPVPRYLARVSLILVTENIKHFDGGGPTQCTR